MKIELTDEATDAIRKAEKILKDAGFLIQHPLYDFDVKTIPQQVLGKNDRRILELKSRIDFYISDDLYMVK